MIKLLHTADWHLDASMGGFTAQQRSWLRKRLLAVPDQIVDVALKEGCDLMLLSGDVFDGAYSRESWEIVYRALQRVKIPVLIAPGNHDFYCESSPWVREKWPVNVHVFNSREITSVSLPQLDCRVYGAAFTSMECPGLLEGFRAECQESHALLVLHGDPTSPQSPYCPVTAGQVREAGLDYVALGHIHAPGRFGAGAAMCAWPGCPMGKGFDETGPKGVLVAEIGEQTNVRFLPLDVPRFYELTTLAGEDPASAVEALLPVGGSPDFFRIRLTGEVKPGLLDGMTGRFGKYPNLVLLDETVPTEDYWALAGEDTLEGTFFQLLRSGMEDQDEQTRQDLERAAKLSYQILQGREVELP